MRTMLLLCGVVIYACFGFAGELIIQKDTGYRGIWYYNQKTETEYVYKYSGGLGTYCADHIPMAIYVPEVNKTFFVYGGTPEDKNTLHEMISYYDHAARTVPRPTLLMDKKTTDAHDNPVLSIDGEGYLWVFISSHGTSRPSYLLKSRNPYDIDDFELIWETNFSYPQPWYIEGKGFLFLHTYYAGGRGLNWSTSPDGRNWSERRLLSHIQEGHYQVSWQQGERVGTAFNYHPTAFAGNEKRKGLNWRTNVYYMQTDDFGDSWQAADGTVLETPLTERNTPALVCDHEPEELLAYIQDIKFDAQGRPAILYLTSKGWAPGPETGPRTWRVAYWTGEHWRFSIVCESDNNYDTGGLYIETDQWRILGPTETGPQAYNPGGEMALWISRDQGRTWSKEHDLTRNSEMNHTFARPVYRGNPGFMAYWADGHGRQPSISRLYFYDDSEKAVYRLPYAMDGDTAQPERIED